MANQIRTKASAVLLMPHATHAPENSTEILLHGWDSEGGFWHGPTELKPGCRARAILQKLLKAPNIFHGSLPCRMQGMPSLDFPCTVYDLTDAGVAIVHLNEAPRGPVAVLVAVPAHRKANLRGEFAFEFVSFLRFIGALHQPDSELALIDYIDNVLRTEASSSTVFAIEAAPTGPDVGIVLSTHIELLSVAMLQWLCARDSDRTKTAKGRPSPSGRASHHSVA